MTDAGSEFYHYAVAMLREAEQAETAIRHRLSEPIGTVRFTAGKATMQFAMGDMVLDFLVRYPKVNIVAHATDQNVDIIGENFDVAIRAHRDPLADSTLVQRTLVPAPCCYSRGQPTSMRTVHRRPLSIFTSIPRCS